MPQTAINPQTGERIVLQNGQWVPMPQGGPQAGPINSGVDPADVRGAQAESRQQAEFDYRRQQDALVRERQAREDAQQQQEQAQQEERRANAQQSAVANLRRVIDKIDTVAIDAADNGGWFETGTSGALVRSIPGTAAYDLSRNLETIDANNAFTALQQMRDNSPTGGALGQITERELDLLRSTIANLDPNQSAEQFFGNLAVAKTAYLDMLEMLEPGARDTYNTRPGIRYDPDGAAYLTTIEGEDNRERQNPFGAQTSGGNRPPSGPDGGVTTSERGFFTGSYSPSAIGRALAEGTGSMVEGIGDTLGIFVNPIGQTMYSALGYDQRYDTGEIMRGNLPRVQEDLHHEVIGGTAAAMTGGLGARAASTAVTNPAATNALATLGRTPVRDSVAGGTAAGASYAAQDYGPVAQTGAALVGGFVGYGGANALANALESSAPTSLAQAAARQNVDLLPADAGGPVAQAVTTGTRASPLSVSPVVNQARAQQGQMANAARRAANDTGEVLDTQQAGESIRTAAQNLSRQTAENGSRMYDRAYQLAEGVTIVPEQTIANVRQRLARLQEDPSAPESARAELQRFLSNIEGGVSIRGLRDARTRLSQGTYDGQLRSNSEKQMWREILDGLSGDIDSGLREAGRDGAADLFQRADQFWSQRVDTIDEVLQPILGNGRSGEEILQAVEAMSRGGRGGNVRLGRLLNSLPEAEAANVRATIVDRIGRATPGQQNDLGTAFSAQTFLTNWNRMTPQAKASLFGSNQLRRDLNDLAELASGMRQSQSLANFSNTGVAIGSNAAAGTALFLAHPALAATGAAAQYLTGRLMASPGFARLLARTSRMPPEAANRHFSEQLAVLGTREPLLRADIQALQRAINDNAPNAGRAVAEDETEQQ